MKKFLAVLFLGLALGGTAGFFGHAKFGGGIPALAGSPVEARVTLLEREGDRLRMTLQTADSIVLATFTRRVDEVQSIVHEGTQLTIRLPGDRPLVDDPPIVRVHSVVPPETETAEASAPEAEPQAHGSEEAAPGDAPDVPSEQAPAAEDEAHPVSAARRPRPSRT